MSHMHGNGGSRKQFTTTNSGRIKDGPAVTDFIRLKHKEKTRRLTLGRKTAVHMPFVLFLALQAVFFGCIVLTRISPPGLHKAFASRTYVGVPTLPAADLKTIRPGLEPALFEEVLQQLRAVDVHSRNGVNTKEVRVSSSLPESTPQAITAIRPLGSATTYNGFTPTIQYFGTPRGLSGQMTPEELHPPAVSEVLVATAGYGRVPAWVGDTPVPVPGQSPRISSGVTGGQIIHQVTPSYPAQARTQGIQGAVVLEAMIREDGTVAEVSVRSSGSVYLAHAAQRAVQQWRFTPFELDGKPVRMLNEITIKFTLP